MVFGIIDWLLSFSKCGCMMRTLGWTAAMWHLCQGFTRFLMKSLVSKWFIIVDGVLHIKAKCWLILCRAYFTQAICLFLLSTVNAADNKQRDKNMNCIKISIDVWVIINTAHPYKISSVTLQTCIMKCMSTSFLSVKTTPSVYGITGRVFLWWSTRWRRSMCLLSSLDSSSPPVTTMTMRRKWLVSLLFSSEELL